jgi:hypothetical protein
MQIRVHEETGVHCGDNKYALSRGRLGGEAGDTDAPYAGKRKY